MIMSTNRRLSQMPTSYDESVITSMEVVPKNNNHNVATMYHPVIEGINPSGSNITCLNKCMKVSSNFTMSDGTVVLLFNMSAKGSNIGRRYTLVGGKLTTAEDIKTPFNPSQYRLQKPVSGVISVSCNTITGTDFTLSGQCSALGLYDLPVPTPTYEDLPKYSLMPTFSRVNVALEDGVTCVMLPAPTDFSTMPRMDVAGVEAVTVEEALTQEPITTGSLLPGQGDDYNAVTVSAGYYTCGTAVVISFDGEDGTSIGYAIDISNDVAWRNQHEGTINFGRSTPINVIVHVPTTSDKIRIRAKSPSPSLVQFSLYSMDPLLYKDTDLKHLIYLQGSLSPKNIVVAGELRKQIVPLTDYIPVTELHLPIPYDPKTFEACAMLAQMPDYGIVLKRSEYSKLAPVSIDEVASVSSGECAIADYWKLVVAALKKAGIKPAELGKKILAAGNRMGTNLLDYAERRGFALEPPTEGMKTVDINRAFCMNGDGKMEDVTKQLEENFSKSPQRDMLRLPIGDHMIELAAIFNTLSRITPKPSMMMFVPNARPPTPIGTINQEIKELQKSVASLTQMVKATLSQRDRPLDDKQNKDKHSEETKPKVRSASCSTGVREGMSTLDLSIFAGGDDETQPTPEEIEDDFKTAKTLAETEKLQTIKVEEQEVSGDPKAKRNLANASHMGLTLEKNDYMSMFFFKMNGGWHKYIRSMYIPTETARNNWASTVKDFTTDPNANKFLQDNPGIKLRTLMADCVVANPEYKMFQPFLIQTDKMTPMVATVLVHFDNKDPGDEYYTKNFPGVRNVHLSVNKIMEDTEFGEIAYEFDLKGYKTPTYPLVDLLYGTNQWKSFVDGLSAGANKIGTSVYIVVDFDTISPTLNGASWLGAFECAVFGKCPFLFVEYSFVQFAGKTWPVFVGKEFKQYAFEQQVADKILPDWWPTTLPVSVWYETIPSFASWHFWGAVKPQPYDIDASPDPGKFPILAGPFSREWILDYSPYQMYKTDFKVNATTFDEILNNIERYKGFSSQKQAKIDAAIVDYKNLIGQMAHSQWFIAQNNILPMQVSTLTAAKIGIAKAYPGALSIMNSLMASSSGKRAYKVTSDLFEFKSWLKEKGLTLEGLSSTQFDAQRKMFNEEKTARNRTMAPPTKKSKKERDATIRANQNSKSTNLITQKTGKVLNYDDD